MKRILLLISICLLLIAGQAQTLNPTQGITVAKPLALSNGGPIDHRSMKYDMPNFLWRPFKDTAEVFAYLNLPKYRTGKYVIFINEGGVLNSNGTFTGGQLGLYWFRDSTRNVDLVKYKVPTSSNLQEIADNGANLIRRMIISSTKRIGLESADTISLETQEGFTYMLPGSYVIGHATEIDLQSPALKASALAGGVGASVVVANGAGEVTKVAKVDASNLAAGTSTNGHVIKMVDGVPTWAVESGGASLPDTVALYQTYRGDTVVTHILTNGTTRDSIEAVVSVPTDATPTNGSTNAVQSGGVKDYVDSAITANLSGGADRLTTPTVTASATSTTEVSITWPAITNATGYKVERSTDNTTYTAIGYPSSASLTNTGLTASTTYYFRVSAKDSTHTYLSSLKGSDTATTHSSGAFDSDAQALITAKGVTDATKQNAINDFFVGLKSDGVYTKLVTFYLLQNNYNESKWNWVNPLNTDAAYRLTEVGTFTYAVDGATLQTANGAMAMGASGAGTRLYDNTSPLTQNSIMFGVSVRTDVAGTSSIDIGGSIQSYFNSRHTDAAVAWGTVNGTAFASVPESGIGRWVVNRTEASTFEIYKNGTSLTLTPSGSLTSTTPASTNGWAIFNQGVNGGSQDSFRKISAAWVATGMTSEEIADFDARVATLETALLQ